MTRLLPVLAAFAVALFAVMSWYLWTEVVPGAGGRLPFDARAFGYTPDTAKTYLEALNADARAVYMLQVRWLDTLFPPALGVLLVTLVWHLGRGAPAATRLAALLPVAAYVFADLRENALVQDLLRSGPEAFDPARAALASTFTRSKFVMLALAVFGLVLLTRASRKGAPQ